jgi:hypothetical protein
MPRWPLEEELLPNPSCIIIHISSLSVYFIKLSTTNYCTHTSINITPHLPLKVVMGLIIVFVVPSPCLKHIYLLLSSGSAILFSHKGQRNFFYRWIFWYTFIYFIQHCSICRPSDSTVSGDAGIELRTVLTLTLAAYLPRNKCNCKHRHRENRYLQKQDL